jgi:hypothetical protein
MMRSICLLSAGLVSLASPADAAMRAVFVGIDHYRYSEPRVPGAGFKDLRGAAGDAQRIKDALNRAYGLELDAPAAGECRSANKTSVTLTDDCADRASILAALTERIAASAPGDTLIFYYAGHGSQFIDDQEFDQASGRSDTIMPTDARKPGAPSSADILDRELFDIINKATAAGINVVSIFDSCNSGTATRDFAVDAVARSAPPLRVPGRRAAAAPSLGGSGSGSGYRVHLAAAADGEVAQEVGGVGPRAGVFTTALAATLLEMPQARFADIAAEVRLKLEQAGHLRQNPQAEGALRASLGGDENRVALLDAAPADGGVVLQGGQLSGVTPGSSYALFATVTEALRAGAPPLAAGRVTDLQASQALLALDARPERALPQRLVARETAHAFGQQLLNVRNQARTAAGRDAVNRAVAALPFARLAEPAQVLIGSKAGNDSDLALYNADGSRIGGLGAPGSESLPGSVRDGLQKIARVQALLALRTAPASAEAAFCISSSRHDVFSCPNDGRRDEPVLKLDQPVQITVRNLRDDPRYVYVLGIDAEYSVTLLLPPNGGRDPALGARQPLKRDDVVPNSPGRYRFVTIATDAPINAQALEQDGAGTRDPGSCVSALERALCDAASGSRDPSTPRVGAWTATVSSAIVR